MVNQIDVKTNAYWIRVHVVHPGNERADELAKAATECLRINVVVKLTPGQVKKLLLAGALANRQIRWDHNFTGRRTDVIFPRVTLKRL